MKLDTTELKCRDHNKLVTIYCCSCDTYFCKKCDKEKHNETEKDSLHIRGIVNEGIHNIDDEESDSEDDQKEVQIKVENILRKSNSKQVTNLVDLELKSPMKKDSPYYNKSNNSITSDADNGNKKENIDINNIIHDEDDPFDIENGNTKGNELIDVNELHSTPSSTLTSNKTTPSTPISDDEKDKTTTTPPVTTTLPSTPDRFDLKKQKDKQLNKSATKLKNYKKNQIIGDSDEEEYLSNGDKINYNYNYDDDDDNDGKEVSAIGIDEIDSNNSTPSSSSPSLSPSPSLNKPLPTVPITKTTKTNKDKKEDNKSISYTSSLGGLTEQCYEEDIDDSKSMTFKNPGGSSPFRTNSCALEEGEEDEYNIEDSQEKEAKHVAQGLVEGAVFFGSSIGLGLSGIIAEPIIGAKDEGAKGFFKGIGKGLSGALLNPVKATGGLLTRTAEGLRNTPSSVFHTRQEEVMGVMENDIVKEKEAAHLFEGIAQGTVSLGKNLFLGVSGVVMEPIRGAKDDGAKGFFKGCGKGLLGVVCKPASGIIDFVSRPIEGLANSPHTFVDFIEKKLDKNNENGTFNINDNEVGYSGNL